MKVRISIESDRAPLVRWLSDKVVMRWFPVCDHREIDDTVNIWLDYRKKEAALTIEEEGKPLGMGVLYIHPYEKTAHQCLFAIIVDAKERGKGVGTKLLAALEERAKKLGITLLHLEVYEGNPAEKLYRRCGFEEYGRHEHFIKENSGKYLTKIMMQKRIRY